MRVSTALALILTSMIWVAPPASSTTCTTEANAADNAFAASFCQAHPGDSTSGTMGTGTPAAANSEPVEIWTWRPICDRESQDLPGGLGLCTSTSTCADGYTLMRRWRIEPPPPVPGEVSCRPDDIADQPVITPEIVLRAFRRIPLPEPKTHVQPDDTTLVNLETIFYTDAAAFDRSITLLGQRVELAIRPTSFRWVHGDGTASTTETAGAAYPSKDVVHRYRQAGTTVRPHVEVTWSATYRVAGGRSRPVPGTVTTAGPPTSLQVVEAIPALSGAGH